MAKVDFYMQMEMSTMGNGSMIKLMDKGHIFMQMEPTTKVNG
jgi:hypothetical protein